MGYRPEKPCPMCCGKTRARSDRPWVCLGCEPDAVRHSVAEILQNLTAALPVNTQICAADGCLIIAGETCPACTVRRTQHATTTARTAAARNRPVLPPPGWARKGGILVRKKAA